MRVNTASAERKIEEVIESLAARLQQLAPDPRRLGRPCTVTASFNNTQLMDAFLRDLPRRTGIERWLAHYQRKLYAMRKHAPMAAFGLAA